MDQQKSNSDSKDETRKEIPLKCDITDTDWEMPKYHMPQSFKKASKNISIVHDPPESSDSK
jgi:hypothetical protein